MENNEVTKEEIKVMMGITGEARGVTLQTDAEYVLLKKGKDGLGKVEEKLKEMGCPIDYKHVKATDWYPVGLRALSLIAIKETFNWTNEEIEDMGNVAPKYSFFVKLLMKYFLTLSMTYEESPKYWKKHYTIGELETPDYSPKKKYFIIRVKGFKIHPILCVYLGGYFKRISQFVLKNAKNFKITENKCMFRGDPYHETLITYE
jgi:hypothetical protein